MSSKAIALITGTPKSEVHKVNQRKLVSVLEVNIFAFVEEFTPLLSKEYDPDQ
jgi:hypothetical protein